MAVAREARGADAEGTRSQLGAKLGLQEKFVRCRCMRARCGGSFVFPGGGQMSKGEKGAGKVWYAHVEGFKYSLTLATNCFLR